VKLKQWFACAALLVFVPLAIVAQTRKPLTNDDIINMTKQGFGPPLIIKLIQTSDTNFDVSPQALIDLKSAGVSESVMEAMLSPQASPPGATNQAVHADPIDPSRPICSANGCLLKEGTQASMKFENALSSKTAKDGDPVEFVLDDDLKVGGEIVVAKGARASATVTEAKKAGMLGKGGELDVQLQYLVAGDNHVRLRGTKSRQGDNKIATTVVLTAIFGPIGLINHGKNGEIPAGTTLTAYVDQDIWLPPLK
jgi:hypothetical protein